MLLLIIRWSRNRVMFGDARV